MIIDITTADIIKTAAVIISAIILILFKKQIKKIVSDMLIGGDSVKYREKTKEEILGDVNNRINEVLR
ncbi:MAG: hypothetical protein WCR83_06040 [Candidatus Methanomethylophilaceae archaeon]